MNEPYISNQICVLKTTEHLIAFYDKLRVASVYNYAQLHANGEYTENDRKINSLIGLVLMDYSKGTGQNNIKVKANLSPDVIEFIFSRLYAGFPIFEYKGDKIYGTPDKNGYSDAYRVFITRNTHGYDGTPRKNPWCIDVQNGKGIKVKNKNGGTFMQKGSFKLQSKVVIGLLDADMFVLLNRIVQYIHMWEAIISPSLITNGKRMLQASLEQRRQEPQESYPNGHAA
ncbi:MAG: hypothetical protein Q4D16_15580 [Eubacteriales bacterium]|nr:hypothetical protein [Eubacteriales bacterium]